MLKPDEAKCICPYGHRILRVAGQLLARPGVEEIEEAWKRVTDEHIPGVTEGDIKTAMAMKVWASGISPRRSRLSQKSWALTA
jgi:hypothetical protein